MSLFSQSREVARVDLVVERRIGDTFKIVLPFSIIALIIFSLAIQTRVSSLTDVGEAVFWTVAVLFGMQIALRQSASDSQSRRDMAALLGLDPAARFLGRSASAGALLIAYMTVLFLTMIVFFDPDLGDGWPAAAAVAIVLVAVGLALLSTLAGEIAVGLRNRSSLASLIVAPLAIPVVVGGSQLLGAIDRGDGILVWILLLLTSDLALLVAGIGLSRPLEEASR